VEGLALSLGSAGTAMRLEVVSRFPVQARPAPPLLFVHGAFHGAWCWDVHFLRFFAQHGYAAHAVSLRGHGQSEGREQLRWTRLAGYVEDLGSAARQLPAPPILVGHSLGGLVIQKYLETSPAPAAVLLASVPPSGVLPLTLRLFRRHPAILTRVILTMRLYPIIATPALAREALFSEGLFEEALLSYWRQLQDESYRCFLDMLGLDLPTPAKVKTPLLVLGAAEDAFFNPGEVAATARAYGTEAEIVPATAHDMMLEPRWQATADRIRAWLDERKL